MKVSHLSLSACAQARCPVQGFALALAVVALAAWLLWDWLQNRLHAREREAANSLTQNMDVEDVKRIVGEVCISPRDLR